MKRYLLPLLSFALLISIFGSATAAQAKRHIVAPTPGLWQVTGKDTAGTHWTAFMRLKTKRIGAKSVSYSGFFDWRSADGKTSGRELFNGWYSKRSGVLSFKAYRAKFYRGEIGVGNYSSLVSNGGRFIKGRWFGADVIPGTWQATWIKY